MHKRINISSAKGKIKYVLSRVSKLNTLSADGPRALTGRGGGSKFSKNWLTNASSPYDPDHPEAVRVPFSYPLIQWHGLLPTFT